MWGCELNPFGSGQGPVTICCDHCNEQSGPIRFYVLTTVDIMVTIFRVVTLCSFIRFPEGGGCKFLRNAGTYRVIQTQISQGFLLHGFKSHIHGLPFLRKFGAHANELKMCIFCASRYGKKGCRAMGGWTVSQTYRQTDWQTDRQIDR